MTPQISAQPNDLWAITSYFNPSRFARRLLNYRIFREHLRVPLLTVELTHGEDFELAATDADVVVQIKGGAVLWQKERLLNLALQALPRICSKVAWLDCDILFERPDWSVRSSSLLDRFPIIQLFENVHHLPPDTGRDESPAEYTRPSAAFSIASGVPAAACLGHTFNSRQGTSAPGLAWAARKELLDRHGFFDGCILGGGDRALICAATGCFDELASRHYMNARQTEFYMRWAAGFFGSVQSNIGYLKGDISHLWHGTESNRDTRARHEGLQRFGFDPFTDIAVAENGSWRWDSDKADMHEYIRAYFDARKEDG